MNLTKVPINTKVLLDKAILLGVTPSYAYEGGERTQRIDGYRYNLVLPTSDFEKVSVKIPGVKKLDVQGESFPVRFDNPVARIYYSGGSHDITISADDIHALTDKG